MAELDEVSLLLVLRGECRQHLLNRQQFVIFNRCRDFEFLNVESLSTGAVARGPLVAGILNEDAAHGLGRRSEEMSAARKLSILMADQSQPGFLHQGGGLQCLAW